MNGSTNRQWQVARSPDSGGLAGSGGLALSADIFKAGESAVPVPGPGQLLIRSVYFSPDPMNHAWVRGIPGKFAGSEPYVVPPFSTASIVATPVPEPSTLFAIVLPAAALLMRRRSRR